MNKRIIHFDLDGVLADFRKAFSAVHGCSPDGLSTDEMWARVASIPEFFLRLEILEDGYRLLDIARSLGEIRILTALPRKTTYARAEEEKRRWTELNIGAEYPFEAVQFASQKAKLARAGDILVDDSPANIRRWIDAGGTGILFTNFDGAVASLLAAFDMDRADCLRRAAELNERLHTLKRLIAPDPAEDDEWVPVVDPDANQMAWFPKKACLEYQNWLFLRFVVTE